MTKAPKEIRQIAWDVYTPAWKAPVLMALVYFVATGLLSSIPAVGWALTIFVSLPLAYILLNGMRHFLLGRKEEATVTWMWEQIKGNYQRSFFVYGLVTLFTFLWGLLLIVPGIIKSYAYAMAAYIAEDEPETAPMETLRKSEQLMKGHKLDLFILDLTFIGWYMLGALCLGIGIIFVLPYHYMARAEFYQELVTANEVRNAPDAQSAE